MAISRYMKYIKGKMRTSREGARPMRAKITLEKNTYSSAFLGASFLTPPLLVIVGKKKHSEFLLEPSVRQKW